MAILGVASAAGAVGVCSCDVRHVDFHRYTTTAAVVPNWDAVFQRVDGWLGGDGAATVPLPGGEVLWLFGDSGVGRVKDGKYAPGSTLVNNSVAVQKKSHDPAGDPPQDHEIDFVWGERGIDRAAGALFVPPRAGEWYWPTGGGAAFHQHGPKLVLFMSRLFRPRENDDSVWNFEGRGSDLLWIEDPGADPRAWRPEIVGTPGADATTPGRRITWGTSVWVRAARRATELYIFGVDTTDGSDKKAVLARVDATDARDPAKWRFWAGESRGGWSADLAAAAPIAGNVMDEFSVTRIHDEPAGSERFVMIYSEPMLGRRVLCRAAPAPAGPWGEPVSLYTCPEPGADPRIIAYSAKAHPELSGPGTLLVSYCVNSTDFWHMLSDASIYRPRFIRVPLSMLPAPPVP